MTLASVKLVLLASALLTILGQNSCLARVVQLDFRLTPSVVKPLDTTNVTLLCAASELNQYYSREQRVYMAIDPNYFRTDINTDIVRIRILKNSQDKWRPIAQLSDIHPESVQVLDDKITSVDGVISDSITKRTFLSVTWNLATADTFGQYRCDAISFDAKQTAVLSQSSQINIGSELDSLAILRLLKHETKTVFERMKKQEDEETEDRSAVNKTQIEMELLEEKITERLGKLENKIEEQNEQLETMETGVKELLVNMSRVFDERLVKIESKVEENIDSVARMRWPRGTYGLLAPSSGCPDNDFLEWKTGSHKHHTESTSGENLDSAASHMMEPVKFREDGDNFLTQHFCTKIETNMPGPEWPEGSYCINKKGECPKGFVNGTVRWDEEDNGQLQNTSGEVPDGEYASSSTSLFYCCRQDGSPDVPIDLPTFDPFYLYRIGGICQIVRGMDAAYEYVDFDTENTKNFDSRSGQVPDGTINNVRLELCYYEHHQI